MVAVSRSSLRRPKLRGIQKSSSSPRSPSQEENDSGSSPTQPTQSKSDLRAKRGRAITLSEHEQDQKKRRKLGKTNNPPQLRIPLRSRAGAPKAISPKSVTQLISVPESRRHVSQSTPPLDSPTSKPQYDQIKRIEEKARQSIQNIGSQTHPQNDRRKLRSEHGGSRSKTELAQYFPSFEDMLSLEPPDPEALTAHTKIVLVDDTPNYEAPAARNDPFGSQKPLHNTQIIDLSGLQKLKTGTQRQGLDIELYSKIHRKAERHEKQMKNGDRERAQHEKYQLERLLDDLRGPDWLKTLGISGITDGEKKKYEPKRALFIRETRALINKFKWWKEEERRRKLEREQALLEEAADKDEENSNDGREDGEDSDDDGGAEELDSEHESEHDSSSSSQAPNSSEIDALASQQLLEEAKSASKRKKIPPKEPLEIVPPYRPFTSFFEKRHLRDAAISGRQRGRTILAFGHPVPEILEQDFELPETILTDDAIRASQRHRRRLKRGVDD